MKYASMADRLIANSVLSPDHAYDGTPCWEWMRRLNNHGYPTLTRRLKRGPRKGQVVTVFAHRESIVAFTGRRTTPRMVALHLKGDTGPRSEQKWVDVGGDSSYSSVAFLANRLF